MKNKQLILINTIILIIFVSIVRIGINKENLAHAQFINESVEIEKNKEKSSNLTLTRNYHDFTISLEDITYPQQFNKDDLTNLDEREETNEIVVDVDEKDATDQDDPGFNNGVSSTDTDNYSEAPNNIDDSRNFNPPIYSSPPVQVEDQDDKGVEENKGEGSMVEPEKEPESKPEHEPDPEPEEDPEPEPEPEEQEPERESGLED